MGNCPCRSGEKGVDFGEVDDKKVKSGPWMDEKVEEVGVLDAAAVAGCPDEMVRRINQELVEFRQQLKKSQELFHAMQSNGSASSAMSLSTVTQSCPLLLEPSTDPPGKKVTELVCCSTQTEPVPANARRSSSQHDGQIRSLLDAIDDHEQDHFDPDHDPNYLDKLSDDISYRLTINLPTVLEESEQETETSPGGGGSRRMSSVDRGRRRLVRMANAAEEESSAADSNHKCDDDDAFKSDNEYRSAMSSVNTSQYNSLERPLQMGGTARRNGDSDSISLVSDGTTIYGSPLSSPSSPTYWTPKDDEGGFSVRDDRIRQLQRELDEARNKISNEKDLNSVLSARIQELEKDYFNLEAKKKELNRDENVVSELSKCYKRKDKTGSEETLIAWTEKGEDLQDENTITDTGNNLENNHSLVTSESSPVSKEWYLRQSLHPDIAATVGDGSIGATSSSHNKNESASSIGVIPESEKEQMIQYAYDPVRRCSELRAEFLSGPEWRTLRTDLDKTNLDNYRKRFAQEEGNDIEGGMAIEGQRPSNTPDLQEEAEEYLESFPNLVEQLFMNLDVIKKSQHAPTDNDLKTISERFNHLALTFQTEHVALTNRKESKLSEHGIAKNKMEKIIHSLSENVQKLEELTKKQKVPEEVTEISDTLNYLFGDLDLYSNNLSKTSRRVGMMDVQVRLYKMVEVMVLYVHILRNLCAEKDKDFQTARKLLAKNNIQLTISSRSKSDVMMNNNNNNDRICWDEGVTEDGESQHSDKPRQILQHLLGPKKSSVGFDPKEKKPSSDHIRHLSELYEAFRCELFWPWNWEETWKGTKQGFSAFLMIVGLLIIFRSLFPIVSADPPPLADLASVFCKHGHLDHTTTPPL